jgi:hypothetical protein
MEFGVRDYNSLAYSQWSILPKKLHYLSHLHYSPIR